MPDPDYNRRHPESTFQAEYPYNQATVTRSGHEIHVNDTPGNESLRIAHTTGSYAEINKEGSMVVSVVKKLHYYVSDSFSETVDGHKDVRVRGNLNCNYELDVSEQIAGSREEAIRGNYVLGIGQSLTHVVNANKYENTDGDNTVYVGGNLATSIGGTKVTTVTGVRSDIMDADWSVTSAAKIEMSAADDFKIKCKNFIVEAGENVTITAGGQEVTITSGGQITARATSTALVKGSTAILEGNGGKVTVTSGVALTGSFGTLNGRSILTA